MPTNKLTDAKCKAAKPDEKDYKLFDGGGLFLWVSPKGGKTWRMAYRFEGKPKTITFGPYPEVSLAEARDKRDEVKTELRDDIDPMESRKKDDSDALKFREASEQYWTGREDISESYRKNAEDALKMHLFPKLGDKPIASITQETLMESLNVMNANGKYVYVRKVRMWASHVFEWAIANKHATTNPASEIKPKKAFGNAKVKNFAAVELHEVPTLMQRIALENQNLQSVLACKFMALTWVRTKELRALRWADIDFEEKVWRIPLDEMKKSRDHLVPLSRQALEILEAMQARSRGSEYVFCAEHRLDRPISENAVLALFYRMGYQGIMTGHGWRSVASTWGNENEYNEDAIERQLSHVPKNKIRAVYNRAKYWDIRKKMVQDWADWLDQAAQIDLSSLQRGKFPTSLMGG